jgi:hypothetical protein
MRFPSKRNLKNKLLNRSTENSVSYLLRNQGTFSKYKDIEDFILRDEEWATQTNEDPRTLQSCEHHLGQIRTRLANELWSRGFYLGLTVLDDLLFSCFAHLKSKDPISDFVERLRDSGVLRPGIVLYPLHTLGILGVGILYSYTSARAYFDLSDYGMLVSPQSNSMNETTQFLEHARDRLGIKKKLPYDLIEHWQRSRPTKWLERNPLLVLKVHTFPGDYYENQFLLISKLKLATSLLCMLYALQPQPKDHRGLNLSSSRSNNWETLDIKHYILFYPKPYRRELTGDCIPMNVSRASLAELSEVPIQLDPKFWMRRISSYRTIKDALEKAETGFAAHRFGKNWRSPATRVYRKVFRSLEFYKKSFRQRSEIGESAVDLAVAFEILLTDNYSKGVHSRLMDRLSTLLQGVRGTRRYRDSVAKLYEMRSKYVHSGYVDDSLDLPTAQAAFVHAFLALSSRFSAMPKQADEPIRELIESSS